VTDRYSDEKFAELLHESHETLENFRNDVRRYLIVDRLLNKEVNSKISVTDADIQQYFDMHQAQYNLMEDQYGLNQIVVGTSYTSTPLQGPASRLTTDAEAKARVEAIRIRLESGENFSTVAQRYSDDKSGQFGGNIGFFSESQLRSRPGLFEAVSNLKVGQISEVLRAGSTSLAEPLCYRILMLIAHEKAGHRSLDPLLQQEIHTRLQDERSQVLQIAYLQTLRDGAQVQNHLAERVLQGITSIPG
jgi:peptidyl-prolyl cis-trans isomerase SurA